MESDHLENRPRSILIINPNTSQSMTDALVPMINSLGFDPTSTTFAYFTAPTGVPSINNESDAALSATVCLPLLQTHHLPQHDAFLVCCYSAHPLVLQLRQALASTNTPKPVTGIFEASISTSLTATASPFGIVSTGAQWSQILDDAVAAHLGFSAAEVEAHPRYAGTETTGLNAGELHSTPKDEVDRRMKEATKRVLRRGARAVCLGCAGMAGLDRVVREACIEELGEDEGRRVKVVDGVVSGALFLEAALRAGW